MIAEAIRQAVLEIYLRPLDAIIERRTRYYLALGEKDPFIMPEDEAAKHHRRMKEIAEEVETLGNVRDAINELHQTYHKRLEEAEKSIFTLRHQQYQITLDYITFRQLFESEREVANFLMQRTIESEKQNKKAA